MVASERRLHVRLKPSLDLPVRVALVNGGPLREALDVIDLSVGGLALSSPALRATSAGQHMKLQLTLGGDEYDIDVVARWTSGESIGVQLVDPPPATAQALARYLAELLERGAST